MNSKKSIFRQLIIIILSICLLALPVAAYASNTKASFLYSDDFFQVTKIMRRHYRLSFLRWDMQRFWKADQRRFMG